MFGKLDFPYLVFFMSINQSSLFQYFDLSINQIVINVIENKILQTLFRIKKSTNKNKPIKIWHRLGKLVKYFKI